MPRKRGRKRVERMREENERLRRAVGELLGMLDEVPVLIVPRDGHLPGCGCALCTKADAWVERAREALTRWKEDADAD